MADKNAQTFSATMADGTVQEFASVADMQAAIRADVLAEIARTTAPAKPAKTLVCGLTRKGEFSVTFPQINGFPAIALTRDKADLFWQNIDEIKALYMEVAPKIAADYAEAKIVGQADDRAKGIVRDPRTGKKLATVSA